MMILITGAVLAFALSGCDLDQPPPRKWVSVNVDPIDGTLSVVGDIKTLTLPYEGKQVTITKSGGGDSLDGVWNGTWGHYTIRVTFSGSGNYWTAAYLSNGTYVDEVKGTAEVSGENATIRVTHEMSDGSGSGSGSASDSGPDIGIDTGLFLTITGLDAYEGKIIRARCNRYFGEDGDLSLLAGYDGIYTIIGGQATLKVYNLHSNYHGNYQNIDFNINIDNSNQENLATGSVTVSFSGWSGTGEFVPGS